MTAKEQLQKAIAEAPKRAVQFDDVVMIYVGTDLHDRVARDIDKALAAGKTVVENGISQWVEYWPIADYKKTGSDVYIFDKSGNRVKCEKFLFVKKAGGSVDKTKLGTAWRNAVEVI